MFSSPHGDFSFSIYLGFALYKLNNRRFRPLTGISLFLSEKIETDGWNRTIVFVPSRGFLFFYGEQENDKTESGTVFVPSRGFLFFYTLCYVIIESSKESFRPLTGISLFLSYLIFPL